MSEIMFGVLEYLSFPDPSSRQIFRVENVSLKIMSKSGTCEER